jgi:hypothetical protein
MDVASCNMLTFCSSYREKFYRRALLYAKAVLPPWALKTSPQMAGESGSGISMYDIDLRPSHIGMYTQRRSGYPLDYCTWLRIRASASSTSILYHLLPQPLSATSLPRIPHHGQRYRLFLSGCSRSTCFSRHPYRQQVDRILRAR